MTEYTHTFELLGELVEVSTNSMGSTLNVRFGAYPDEVIIEDSSGDCFSWGELGTAGLHGAAHDAVVTRLLREHAERSIANYIRFSSEYIQELEQAADNA